ncbi:cytochrome c oxidase subunit VIa [Martiniozyma asiatica (nom. inval.)]|nr:cytochrome c oxidase subunit VIa [Martiniozyma asiatica]
MFRQTIRTTRAAGKRFQSSLDRPAYTANEEAANKFKQQIAAVEKHADGSANTWKKISYFVAFPIIAITAVNTYFIEKEHAEHRAHTKHLSDEEWPVPNYPYLNIRRVDFFWGDGNKTLFWNSDCNRKL